VIIFTLLICVFLFINAGEKVDYHSCDIENTAVKGGEKLVYKAYYNWGFVWVPAGEAEFYIKETADTYEVTVRARTYAGYDAFFKVRDYYHSSMDKKTMLPRYFVRHVEQGGYKKFDSLVFYPEKNKAVSFNGPSRARAIKEDVQIDPCTHDLLSVFYFLRNVNIRHFKPGDQIPVKMLFDREIYPIKVRYHSAHRNMDIKGLGKMNAVKIIPDLITGTVFKDGNKMEIYVSDDGNKVPLLVESPLVVGSAKAVLKSHSGLRYKMDFR
jgi:hypothetical protein